VDPQNRSGSFREEEIFTLPGLQLRPLGRRYTDYAIPAPLRNGEKPLTSLSCSGHENMKSLCSCWDLFSSCPTYALADRFTTV
jgi:hypothetical protein